MGVVAPVEKKISIASLWPHGLRDGSAAALFAGITGSNSAEAMYVCHLRVLCVVR